jgi:ADP-heptose:LPS heptosyltransferase
MDGEVSASVDRLLATAGLGDGASFAVLQISCNWGCNELDSGKWARIVDGITGDHGLRCIVIGMDDPHEKQKFAEVAALAGHPPISVHGRTSLHELLELVRRAALVVATDSALTQIALVQQVPSVVMFGIEPLAHNAPLEFETHLMEAVQHWDPELAPPPNEACRFVGSYCHSAHCRENSSLEATTPDEVLERVARVLQRARR